MNTNLVLYTVREGHEVVIATMPVQPYQRDHGFANHQALNYRADWYCLECGNTRGVSYAASRGRQGLAP